MLDESLSSSPGRRRLEVVAVRDEVPKLLRSWEIVIAPKPLGFAWLEPSSAALERPTGSRVSFRAPVENADPEKLSFQWEVNGEAQREARGSNYDFAAENPGTYRVTVLAKGASGASASNTWNLTVRPKPAPPPPVESIPRPALQAPKIDNPEVEARAWIDAYCAAFEQKDTEALIRLGHLSNQAEASRLRDALATMGNLRLSCSNASVQVNGDRATVSFDRIDRWTDPRGTDMSKPLPRITKNLRRNGDRWVAVP